MNLIFKKKNVKEVYHNSKVACRSIKRKEREEEKGDLPIKQSNKVDHKVKKEDVAGHKVKKGDVVDLKVKKEEVADHKADTVKEEDLIVKRGEKIIFKRKHGGEAVAQKVEGEMKKEEK